MDHLNNVTSLFKTNMPSSKAIYFDTEQSSYHVNRLGRRIVKKLNLKENETNFEIYALRRFSPAERVLIIEEIIYNSKDLKLVVIDGVGDLISNGYNDENDSIMIAGKLLKWSEELNLHIITVIHQNKGDNNSKGHLGAQLNQKAETVLNVERLKDNKDFSFVSPAYSRGIDIEDIYFGIDDFGCPYITDAPTKESEQKKSLPFHFTDAENKNLIGQVFQNYSELDRATLADKLKHYLLKDGHIVGDNKIRQWITYYNEVNAITKDSHKSPYKLNKQFMMLE